MKQLIEDLRTSLKETKDYKYALDESYIVGITDDKGIITFVNDNFCKISKYSRAEIIGSDHRILNSGFHTQEFIHDLWESITKGKTWRGELKNKAKDGTTYWVDTTIIPFLDELKKPYQFVAITTDITDRKKAEEENIFTLKKKETVLNRISDAVISLDTDWRYTFLNDAALLTHPLGIKETLGKVIWEVHPEMKDTIFWDKYHEAMLTKKVVEIDGYYDPMDIWFSVKVYPSSDGLTIFYKDITAGKQAKKDLEKSLKEISDYKYAIDESSIVAITDQTGLMRHANDNFCSISKYSREELIGTDHRIINSGFHTEEFINELWTTITHGQIWKGELKNEAKDGTLYWVDTTIVPFLNESGKPFQYIAIAADVTERKNIEAKIVKSNRLYAFLSAINQSIVHANENELLKKICMIATEIGKFKMAWVGILDENNKLHMTTFGGDKDIIIDFQKHSGMDFSLPELINTPTGRALSTGNFAIINDVQNDPVMKPWRKEFIQHGIKSYISLPLKKFGKVIGVLGLNSNAENIFDAAEIKLLVEAVNDISFALENFEKEALHKSTEEIVKLALQQLTIAQTVAHVGSWGLNLSTGMSIWSEEACKIYGLSPEENEQSYQSWEDFIHPEDLEMVRMKIKNSNDSHNEIRFEHRIIWKDGTIKNIYSASKFEFDETGKPIGLLGICHDITEQTKANEKLIQSEAKLKEAQAISHICNWEIDLLTGVNTWSEGFYSIFQLSREEIKPSPESFISLIHPVDFENVKEIVEKTLQNFEASSFTARINTKDGSTKHIYSKWKFEFDKNNKPIRLYGILQDITEKKIAEEKIIHSEIQVRNFARHLNKLQEEERAHIAREIHDELGQELVGIKIALSSFLRINNTPAQNEISVKEMMHSVDGAIQSLRKIATELRPGILDTLGLSSSIEWLGKEFERKTGISCKIESGIIDNKIEKGISICFFRICQEALTNISKHAECSEVRISLLQLMNEIILEVSDNGKGIENNLLKNPFSMGFLGMKERASAIGGNLKIISKKNEGTIIRLTVNKEMI